MSHNQNLIVSSLLLLGVILVVVGIFGTAYTAENQVPKEKEHNCAVELTCGYTNHTDLNLPKEEQ